MACGKKLPHAIEPLTLTQASKITIKNFQLCSIKIREAMPPVTSHATALYTLVITQTYTQVLEKISLMRLSFSKTPQPNETLRTKPWSNNPLHIR